MLLFRFDLCPLEDDLDCDLDLGLDFLISGLLDFDFCFGEFSFYLGSVGFLSLVSLLSFLGSDLDKLLSFFLLRCLLLDDDFDFLDLLEE